MEKSNVAHPPKAPHQMEFAGHPIGLWVLFTTEMWERFCYYSMRAFLVLYLVSSLHNAGFGWSEKSGYELYGYFTGLVYFTPLFGGLIADRFIGPHRSVVLGAILMTLGELFLFASEYARAGATETITFTSSPMTILIFMSGLFLIVLGNGFFKPCISVMVGQLYKDKDDRRDVAFTIFYMGINVGAFFAPLVGGTIAEKYGWHWGFLVAALGMIFGICTYSFFRRKYLPHIGLPPKKMSADEAKELTVAERAFQEKMEYERTRPMGKKDIDRISVILTLTFFVIAFWSVFEQAGSSLTTFAKKSTNREVSQAFASKVPMFLQNEDQTDAEKALEAIKEYIVPAYDTFAVIQPKVLPEAADPMTEFEKIISDPKANEDFLAKCDAKLQEANDPEFQKQFDLFKNDSGKVRDSKKAFDFGVKRTQEARKSGNYQAVEIAFPSLKEIYELGKADQIAFETEAKNRAEKTGKPWVVADVRSEKLKEIDKAREARYEKDAANIFYTFPATWYQSVNPLGIVLLAPLFAGVWTFLAKRRLEPSTPIKFGIGLILLSSAFLVMVPAAKQSYETGGNAFAFWLVAMYILCTMGELCLSPVGLSMVSRLAPARYASVLMGVWLLSSAVACYLSGALAAWFGSGEDGGSGIELLYGKEGGLADYFLLMAMIPFVAGVCVFCLSSLLKKMMHEDSGDNGANPTKALEEELKEGDVA